MPIAYSYKRVSSKKQTRGHGVERQQDEAEKYAALHGLTLDDTYHDLGVSGYHSKNVEQGALGAFLDEVKAGRIAKGSLLLVENLDRLSRDKVRIAMPVFLNIINSGIQIVTLLDSPPQVYSAEKIDADNGMSLFGSMMVMVRAHEESKRKGERVKKAWDKKREESKPMTTICPAWLRLAEDRSHYVVINDKAAVVQRMFKMAHEDGMGVHSIAVTLNKEKVPYIGDANEWQAQNVARILHTKAVFGTMVSPRTGIESEKYYPPIVDKLVFAQVQKNMETRSEKSRGRKGETVANLFSGLSRCGDCGGRLRFTKKSTNRYLHCVTSYSKSELCAAPRMNYAEIEDLVLWFMFYVEALPVVGGGTSAVDPVLPLQLELNDKQARLSRYSDDFEGEEDDTLRKHVRARMKKLSEEIATLEKQIIEYAPPPPIAEGWQRARDLHAQHEVLQERMAAGEEVKEEIRAVRLKLQASLQTLIHRMTLNTPISKVDMNEYASKQVAELTGMREGQVVVEREPDYQRSVTLYGPLIDILIKESDIIGIAYEATDDGGITLRYSLPQWGVNNTGREAEYMRQPEHLRIEPQRPPIIEPSQEELAYRAEVEKARLTRKSRRTPEQVALLEARKAGHKSAKQAELDALHKGALAKLKANGAA